MEILKAIWVSLCEMAPYILFGFLVAGILEVWVDRQTMARHLSGRGWRPVVKAALFGIPLPLCSCGVLPAAVALRRRGASKGATTSFLIATPQTGVDSIAATYSLLGPAFAVIRPIAALIGATFGGMAVGRFGGEDKTDADIAPDITEAEHPGGFFRKSLAAVRYGFIDMVASVGGWLIIGLIVAALITVFVPDELFVSLSRYPLLAMLAVVVVAIPMYVCATGSIPIAMSLMMKGLSPGIAFVMLMAGPAANFASILILSKTQGRRATVIYVLSVVVTAIVFGLLIDLTLPREWFAISGVHAGCHEAIGPFPTACAILLLILLAYTQIVNRKHHHHHHLTEQTDMKQTFKVIGMNCPHCQASVQRAIASLPGVEAVDVDLHSGAATVAGNVDAEAVCAAVSAAGFSCSAN